MEAAPLVRAYDQSRTAALYTYKGSLNAARESHENAASSFASASQSTDDPEALRILRLLEDHHKRLAKVISSTSIRRTSSATTPPGPSDTKADAPSPAHNAASAVTGDQAVPSSSHPGPPLIRRPPRRDLSSSIASNLATARGKPSTQRRTLPATPEVTAQHAGGSIVSHTQPEPSSSPRNTSPQAPRHRGPPTNTESFNTFFTSFETLFSKLSAPLAYAGLPLTIEEEPEPSFAPERKKSSLEKPKEPKKLALQQHPSSRATASPDLATLISPAALRAIREDAGPAFGTHESFYVVPPSGGTVTYAGILSRENGGSAEALLEEDDEFVDARESMGPPSPVSARNSGMMKAKKSYGMGAASARHLPKSENGKTMEELELENTALRQLLDTQSKRLQMWEASSQSQSMALAQSLRFTRATTGTAAYPVLSTEHAESERLKELEEQILSERSQRETIDRRNDKLSRENEKLLGILGKYKDKWESLKESARQRERQKAAGTPEPRRESSGPSRAN